MTALRLLAVLNVGFKYARIPQKMSRRAARALYRRASHAFRLSTWQEKRVKFPVSVAETRPTAGRVLL